jgi:hypothetical protein
MNAERILVIDQMIEAIDKSHSQQLGEEQADLISAHLSFLLDIGIYKPTSDERWVIHRDNISNKVTSKRFQLGIWDDNQPSSMPKKGELSPLGRVIPP